eukprot:2900163-Pyramimonas_sp.AAC.1
MARIMVYDLLLQSRKLLSIGRVVNVIDDISGHGIGTRRLVVDQIARFAKGVATMLGEKRLPINWGKTKALASS